jgi:hypothetical protein
MATWNGLPDKSVIHCRKLTKKRDQAARTRLSEDGWLENFWTACEMIVDGKCGFFGDNDRGWKPAFDWILRPDTALWITEGKYTNGTARHQPTPQRGGFTPAKSVPGTNYDKIAKQF